MMDTGPVPLASDVAKTVGSFDLVYIVHILTSSLIITNMLVCNICCAELL